MTAPYKCVVVANGSFPQTELPLYYLRKASVIIACDGAIHALHNNGFEANAIIGDLDSIPMILHQLYAGRIYQIKDQETNDLTKAIHFAHETGNTEVLILGATGLREDHTLGNISLLMDYVPLFTRIEMMSDYGVFTPLLQSATLESTPGQQISLFSLVPEGEISVSGLRWPLDKRKFTAWWQGTLNEATDTVFTVTLSRQAKVMVYRTHDPL